jgi:hypothetical protein
MNISRRRWHGYPRSPRLLLSWLDFATAAVGGWRSGRASTTTNTNTNTNTEDNTDANSPAISRFLSAAVASSADGGCAGAGANYKPEGVATQTLPETATFCSGDSGVAFAGHGF